MKTIDFPSNIKDKPLPDIDNGVGYLSIHVPEELIIAAGKVPYRILGSGKPAKRANAYLPKTFDPYVLDCLESALNGNYKSLDGIVIANTSDAHRRLYDVWKSDANTGDVFFLDVPKGADNLRLKSFQLALSYVVRDMENAFNVKISQDNLNEAIGLCNETRSLLKKLSDMRKKSVPPFTGTEFFQIVKWCQTHEKETVNKALKEYLMAIENANTDESKSNDSKGNIFTPRIMVMGSVMVTLELITIMEKMNAKVVCDDLCIGMPYFSSLVDDKSPKPLDSIAKRYLSIPTARMVDTEARWNYLLQMANDFNINGVIYFALKFDDIYLFEYPHIRDKFQKAGYPVLFVEAENFLTTLGQIETRIQAFIEMLEEGLL